MLPLVLIITLVILESACLTKVSGTRILVESSNASASPDVQQISMRMPDIRPDHAEQYLCISHRMPVDRDGQYIVGFNPQGNVNRVHHMLLYGCQRPGIFQRDSPNFVWDCGQMHTEDNGNEEKSYEQGPVCKGQQHILYGWALDAPALKLPKSVGFKVGGQESNINFLILQVHYGHIHSFKLMPDLTDNSGLILDMRKNNAQSGITRQAGVLILISLGEVAMGKSRHEIWCDIQEDIVIHPFRYRVHTHKLGTRVLGAKIGDKKRTGISDSSRAYEPEDDRIIGVGDPQKPQMFYPVKEKDMTLTKGDSVYAHCEFNNNKTHVVKIGHTGDDEMCNFYLMYWTESQQLLNKGTCFGQNTPSFFSNLW